MFVAPTVLLFILDQYSFINLMSGVLSYKRYYIPLFVYFAMLLSIVFMCLKVYVQWNNAQDAHKCIRKSSLWQDMMIPFIIKLHKWLFAFLTVIMLFYVFKSAYSFIYQRSLPTFIAYYWIVRIGAVALTLYIYSFIGFAVPIVKRGRSLQQAQHYYHLMIAKRWKSIIPILTVQLLWIYVSVLLYTLILNQLQVLLDMDILKIFAKHIEIVFQDVQSIQHCIYNIFLLFGAFLISNLLYSPLILLVNKGLHHFKLTLRHL